MKFFVSMWTVFQLGLSSSALLDKAGAVSFRHRHLEEALLPPLVYKGQPRNEDTRSNFPLGRCEGDCNSDRHCQGDLVCFFRTDVEEVPGCSGGEDLRPAKDYCMDPNWNTSTLIPSSPSTTTPTTVSSAGSTVVPTLPASSPAPSPEPTVSTKDTLQPSPGASSPAPSKKPTVPTKNTLQPTPPASSPAPSPEPTIAPTTFGLDNLTIPELKDVLHLKFSMRRQDHFTAADIFSGREPGLVRAVLSSMLEILCSDTTFVIADSSDEQSGDYCEYLRRLTNDLSFASIVGRGASFEVKNVQNGKLKWTEWDIAFPVLQVGKDYLETAFRNVAASGVKDFNSAGVIETIHREAVNLMEATALAALSSNIRSGHLDVLIGNQVRTSEVGNEKVAFSEQGQEEEGGESSKKRHRMRNVGIASFCITVFGIFMLLHLAHRRKRRLNSEEEEEEKNKGLNELGAIGSLEDLNLMLEAGQHHTLILSNPLSLGDQEAPDPSSQSVVSEVSSAWYSLPPGNATKSVISSSRSEKPNVSSKSVVASVCSKAPTESSRALDAAAAVSDIISLSSTEPDFSQVESSDDMSICSAEHDLPEEESSHGALNCSTSRDYSFVSAITPAPSVSDCTEVDC